MKLSPIKYSIAAQLLKVVFFFYMIVTITVTIIHMIAEFNNTKNSIQNELEVIGQTFAPGLARALWDMNPEQLQPSFLGMIKSPKVTGMVLRNEYDKVVGSVGIIPDGINEVMTKGSSHNVTGNILSRNYSYTFPIVFKQDNKENKVGEAIIYSNIGVVFNQVKLGFFFILSNAFIKTIVLWVLVIVISRFMLSKPLAKLTANMEKLTLDQINNFQIDLDLRSRNELKFLEESFNAMIQKLNDSRNEIAQKQKQLEGIITNTPAVIFIKDVEGRYLHVNPQFESLFHVKLADIIGKTDHDIFTKDMADVFRENDLQVIDTGRPLEIEESAPHDDGLHTYHSIKFPLLDLNNKIYAVCGIASDITQRKISEKVLQDYSEALKEEVNNRTLELKKEIEERKKAKEAAEIANMAKSNFLANMSHELRTPLNIILGFTQLMNRDPNITESLRKHLKTISQSGENLLALINDVLEFSKIENDRAVMSPENFNLFQLLSELERMFQWRAQEKSLSLHFERKIDVPQYIRTDQTKLRQILINLLSNAIKFTEDGGVSLSISANAPGTKIQSHGCFLHFEVFDTGIGIPPEDIDRVFEAFYQSNVQLSSKKGTGLGLSISKMFTELIGGVLEVESEISKGTRFCLAIPVEITDCADKEVSLPTRKVIGLLPGQPVFRLLIVEDDEINRNLLAKLLEGVGFDIREAINGRDAIDVWRQWQPHLIWMDMHMPVMDGYAATTHIKTSTENYDSVIIALTACAFEEDRLRAIEHGCNDFVRKPFREAEIFETIEKHIGVKYIYEQDTNTQQSDPRLSNEDIKTMVVTLPKEQLTKLRKAASSCNSTMVEQVIKEIRIQNVTLADSLSAMSKKFAYNEILDHIPN